MLKLLEPTKENLQKMKAGLTELKANPTPYDIAQTATLIQFMEKNFDGYLEDWQQQRSLQDPKGKVPSTTLFLFDDDKFVGFYNIRHYLNDFLKTQGGNIGYQIIPSERKKGYVKQGLKLVLKWCYDRLNLDEVMLSCKAANHTSDRAMTSVMNEVGGHREPDINFDHFIERRIWIKTIKPTGETHA